MIPLVLAASAALIGASGQPVFGWRDGAVYPVAVRPGRVTDIALEPGETLTGSTGVAAGDTVRWVIGETESGAGGLRQTHVLVKPVAAGLATNLVIATDRRVYHLLLTSSGGAWMAQVAWRYPKGELTALPGAPSGALPGALPGTAAGAAAATQTLSASSASPSACASGAASAHEAADLSRLDFDYRLEGDAPWRPVRVYDDGARTVIEFPKGVAAGDMPPVFVLGPKGEDQLVNYRVAGRRMVLDGTFQAAELRVGAGRKALKVRIVREPVAP